MAIWDPLHPSDPFSFQFGNYGLLILNREITLQPAAVEKLWNEATFKATVDGGTDRWLNYLEKHNLNVNSKFPNLISGDFDSVKKETLEYCRENGVMVESTPDQNYTDFQKCLKIILQKYQTKLTSVIVLCDTCGRIDQLLEILNTLGKVHIFTEIDDHPPIFLLTRNSLTWLLTEGEHTIKIPQYLISNEVWCAIMPYKPVEKNCITTTGLKWNLDNMSVRFGGMISTSNTYSGESELDCIIAICESGGDRLDHLLQHINTAGKVEALCNISKPIYLLSSYSLVWYLPKGRHKIIIPRYLIVNKAWCGVVPYEPVENHVTTTGLKWNLDNHFVAFGNMVSTSNTYNGEPHVTISTEAGIIWMMGLYININDEICE